MEEKINKLIGFKNYANLKGKKSKKPKIYVNNSEEKNLCDSELFIFFNEFIKLIYQKS